MLWIVTLPVGSCHVVGHHVGNHDAVNRHVFDQNVLVTMLLVIVSPISMSLCYLLGCFVTAPDTRSW